MLHVSADKVASREGTTKRQFASEDGGGDDAGKALGIGARLGWMRATDTEHVEHGALRVKDGTSTECTDLERGHGDRNLEVPVKAEQRG
jgi:hypothetical protein